MKSPVVAVLIHTEPCKRVNVGSNWVMWSSQMRTELDIQLSGRFGVRWGLDNHELHIDDIKRQLQATLWRWVPV